MGLMDVKSILKMADGKPVCGGGHRCIRLPVRALGGGGRGKGKYARTADVYPDMSWFIPFSTMAAIAVDLARQAKVPVGVHLDHGKSYEIAVGGIAAGFPSIMYDGSARPFEEKPVGYGKRGKMRPSAGSGCGGRAGNRGTGQQKRGFLQRGALYKA